MTCVETSDSGGGQGGGDQFDFSAAAISATVGYRSAGSVASERAMIAAMFAGTLDRRSRIVGRDLGLLSDRHGNRRVTAERSAAGEHLEQQDAHGIHVGGGRERCAGGLLGCEVARRTDHRAGAGDRLQFVEALGDAEVGELRIAGRCEEDVARLHVAVHDAHGVRRGERGEHLGGDADRIGDRQRPVRCEVLSERSSTNSITMYSSPSSSPASNTATV